MQYLLTIKVDMNDADYAENSEKIDETTLQVVKRVAKAIKNYSTQNPYQPNWPNIHAYLAHKDTPSELYEYTLSEEDIDLFQELCPGVEFHSVKSISYRPFNKAIKLL